MKKFISLILASAICGLFAVSVPAQNKTETIRPEGKTVEQRSAKSVLVNPDSSSSSLTAAEVGEPDSFGKNVKFLGTAVSGLVVVYTSCDPAVLLNDLGVTLGVDDRCLAVTNPLTTTTATFNDIGRITIPGRSAANVIYFISNHSLFSSLFNSGTTVNNGGTTYNPTITLESEALLDPAAIDPNTGLPMNGSYTTGISASKLARRTYQVGDTDVATDRYSVAATRGFARSFFADLGLPAGVINKIYTKPLTIKLNMRVSVRLVSEGQFFYSMRFMGN